VPQTFNRTLVENCYRCVNTPTYTTDPNLAGEAFCGEQAYFEPQFPSEALNNGLAPSASIPIDNICGHIRTGGYTLGSYQVGLPPVTAACQTATVSLDATGTATIIASDLDGGSTDGAMPYTFAANPPTVNCAHIAAPLNVTLTVTDALGGTASCIALISVDGSAVEFVPTVITDIESCGGGDEVIPHFATTSAAASFGWDEDLGGFIANIS